MKKRMIALLGFIFILLAIISISAPTYNNINQKNKQFTDFGKNIKSLDIKFPRTFFITHENGRSYFRTFENHNKNIRRSNTRNFNKNQRGIYRDLFDTGHKPKTRSQPFFAEFIPKKKINCPIGWECSK